MSNFKRAALAALISSSAVAAMAGPAHAASLNDGGSGNIFVYQAAPGEVNKVTITAPTTHSFQITDAGAAAITLGPNVASYGCAQGSAPNVVVCDESFGTPMIYAYLGDGNDTLTDDPSINAFQLNATDQPGFGIEAHGDDGNDTFTYTARTPYGMAAYGEAGGDTFKGGPGDDVMYGGDGNDSFIGRAGADTMQGGAGTDLVTYQDGRTSGVQVYDNPGSNAGNTAFDQGFGTGLDHTWEMEMIIGTPWADKIGGDGSDNTINGAGGNDYLSGFAGNDTLNAGSSGASRLVGGSGNDTLNARNGVTDTQIDCNDGTDTANIDLGLGDAPVNCETVNAY